MTRSTGEPQRTRSTGEPPGTRSTEEPQLASALQGRQVGCIGAGAMGEALLGGLLAAGVPAAKLRAAEPDPERRTAIAAKLGIEVSAENPAVVAHSDLVLLAVKPGRVATVLGDLVKNGGVDLAAPLWVSIAAGVTLPQIDACLPATARVVRAMPNTPALIRSGATAYAGNARVTDADRAMTQALFESVGIAWEAPAEPLLDAVTGLSGSGPAYVFVFLEALGDAGVRMGLPRDVAYRLAGQTLLGAARLALESGQPPGELRERVSSPGGTTIAGLERLEACGFRAAIHEAVEAATRRSRELAAE